MQIQRDGRIGIVVVMSDVPSWFFTQASAVPYRPAPGGVEILLITAIGSGRWIVPKGVVDPGRSPAEAALVEAYEEAGVEGIIDEKPIGEYEYVKWGGTCAVTAFAMLVTREFRRWPEYEKRSRRWVNATTAMELVQQKNVRALIDATIGRVAK